MLRLNDFECINPKCQHVFEEMVYLEEGILWKNPYCPLCYGETKPKIGNPMHHKHISHSNQPIE